MWPVTHSAVDIFPPLMQNSKQNPIEKEKNVWKSYCCVVFGNVTVVSCFLRMLLMTFTLHNGTFNGLEILL